MSLLKRSCRHVASTFLAGLVVVVPLIVVVRIGQTVVGFLTRNSFLGGLDQMLEDNVGATLSHFVAMLASILIGFLIVFLAGMLLSSQFTSGLSQRILQRVFSIPVLGPLLEPFHDAFEKLRQKFDDGDELFGECVLVRIDNLQEFGLLTETMHKVDGETKCSVYIPGAPVPTTGRLVVCDHADVTRIDFTKKRLVEALLTFGSTTFEATSLTADATETERDNGSVEVKNIE